MKSSMMTLAAVMLAASAGAQVIDSGSTGADGVFHAGLGRAVSEVPPGTVFDCVGPPLAPDSCVATVPLREPPNHIFNFTEMTVDSNVVVRFQRNAANTAALVLVVGNVLINGSINVGGESVGMVGGLARGGPGGFDGGGRARDVTSSLRWVGGAGGGPGGGVGETWLRGPDVTLRRSSGGNFVGGTELQPLGGGSGGGGGADSILGSNGAGGGGALLVAAGGAIDLGTSALVSNAIESAGGDAGRDGAGSGGTVRLVATTIRGSRSLYALGGSGGAKGSPGVIRIETPGSGMQWTGFSAPQAIFNPPGQPIVIFPPIMPELRVVSIGGVAPPAHPRADAETPDLALPTDFVNPVSVVVEATHVPDGTLVKVIASPQFGAGDRVISAPTPLTGPSPCSADPTSQCMQATVPVTLPPTGVGVISALIDSVVAVP